MKKIFLSLMLVLATLLSASQFCDGFNQGYITGYKKVHNTSLEPLALLCPLKPLKKLSDPKSDFEFGYIIGFEKAMTEN